jgi:hypothetical protein
MQSEGDDNRFQRLDAETLGEAVNASQYWSAVRQ